MNDEYYMRLAIAIARVGMSKGNSPFGACIVSPNREVIACGHNKVLETGNPTAHAEIVVIRKAVKVYFKRKKVVDPLILKDHILYTTTESCPLCWSAAHWARIKKIVCGVSLDVAAKYGFNELKIYNRQLQEISGSKMEIISGVLEEECMQLFADWAKTSGETY